jgi:ketosteroid isomerase-like protein
MRAAPIATLLATGLVVLSRCRAGGSEFTSQDESTVRAMFDSTIANIRAHDWATWSKQYTDDAVVQPGNAKTLKGRAAILSWGQAFPPVEEITFTNVHVSGQGGMAYGTSDYVLKLQGMPADTGKQLVVFMRSASGKWEIPAVSVSSDLPAQAPTPANTRRRQ